MGRGREGREGKGGEGRGRGRRGGEGRGKGKEKSVESLYSTGTIGTEVSLLVRCPDSGSVQRSLKQKNASCLSRCPRFRVSE